MIRILMVAALLISASPVLATANNNMVGSVSPGCKTYQQATKLLQDIYDEKIVGRGLMGRGDDVRVVLEIWANMNTGTWTAIRMLVNGCTQPVQSGDGWHVPLTDEEASE
jgi:hypothetical protein